MLWWRLAEGCPVVCMLERRECQRVMVEASGRLSCSVYVREEGVPACYGGG